MKEFKDVFLGFATAPETQCDGEIAKKIVGWADKGDDLTAKEVKDVLDEIVHGSLASGFVVNVLDMIWNKIRERESSRAA